MIGLLSAKSSFLLPLCRAVAKHCPRSGEGFWGQCRGSEAAKNSAARALLDLMLENCVWINLHRMSGLDGSSAVLELRIPAGYGMRWTVPVQPGAGGGVQFRGCLEPAMPDGHSLGWHHP